MTAFAQRVIDGITRYVALRRDLGYAFAKQAAILRDFGRFVAQRRAAGPLTQAIALAYVVGCEVTSNERQRRYRVVKNFAEYFGIFDRRTESLDPHVLPRSRAIPPARILDDEELRRLLDAAKAIVPARTVSGGWTHYVPDSHRRLTGAGGSGRRNGAIRVRDGTRRTANPHRAWDSDQVVDSTPSRDHEARWDSPADLPVPPFVRPPLSVPGSRVWCIVGTGTGTETDTLPVTPCIRVGEQTPGAGGGAPVTSRRQSETNDAAKCEPVQLSPRASRSEGRPSMP